MSISEANGRMPTLNLYRLLFMAEIFTAEFLFMFRMEKRKLFVLRFLGCILVGCAFTFALPLHYNAFYTSFTFLLFFSVTVPMMKFCCDISWSNAFFCGIAAYTIQHFAYGLANLLMTLISWGTSPILGVYFEGIFSFSSFDWGSLFIALVYVLAYYVTYSLMYMIFLRKIKRGENFKIRSTSIMALVGVGLVVDIFFNAVVVYYGDNDNVVTSVLNILYENTCCFFLLYVQFGLIRAWELKSELTTAQILLREKERQYNLSKESIELINIKCHDLKHQIRAIGEGNRLPAKTVREIESAISIYDAEVRTDNEVLDIILTEKSLKCAAEGIALTCVADGKSLEFMDKTDVYSLFGNALDNAIEAVLRLEEKKRNVGMVVRSKGDMVSVNVHNSYDGQAVIGADGFPVTTKEDKNFHGIGLKSIRQIAEKYHGICTVSTNEDTFILNVLLARK